MVGFKSSCMVPLSHLTPRQKPRERQILDGLNNGESFEVLISCNFERSFGDITSKDDGSYAAEAGKYNAIGTPRRNNDDVTKFVSDETDSTHDDSQSRQCDDVHTPRIGESGSEIVTTQGGSTTSVSVSINGVTVESPPNSVVRNLREKCNSDMGLVNFDVSAIHEAIVSKVLCDAEHRHLVVTFVQDDEYAAEWPDVDMVDHEFEPMDSDPLFPARVNKSVVSILSQLEGNLFDVQHAVEGEGTEEHSTMLPLQPPTADVESFNHAVRFSKIKEKKDQLVSHMLESDVPSKRRLPSSRSDASHHNDDSTKFKNNCEELEQPGNEECNPADSKIPLVVREFSFLKRRKKSNTSSTTEVNTQSHVNTITSTLCSAVTPRIQSTETRFIIDAFRAEEPARRRGILKDTTTRKSGITATADPSLYDIKGHLSSSSFDRSMSQPRQGGSSGSFNREPSQNLDGISKRGVLSDSRNSSGSSNGIKPVKPTSFSEARVFEAGAAQNSDWSSEMWGSFINVIHSRKKTLGQGSFSTVSFAFLRLQPHLYHAKSRTASINTGKHPKDLRSRYHTAIPSDVTGDSATLDIDTTVPESNGNLNDVKNETGLIIADAEPDIVDQMIKIIDGRCTRCANVSTLNCAVKSIKDVFPHARFQYIREKEMMLHFNSNVLKPLACRLYNGDVHKTYQLLMPKAQGDLYEMLKEIIKYRTRKTRKPVYITNPSTGKRELKIIGLTEREVKFLFFQILSGLAFIQMCFQGNIHRHSDLKLQNILVFCKDEDKRNPMKWRLCLADFGCSIMLHPTQHFEGACMFKNLQQSISKEWRVHLSNQLTSFIRGTVRCNAPEALSYDRNGNPRNNRNNNLLMTYKKSNLNMSCITEDNIEQPKIWGMPSVSDDLSRVEPRSPPKVAGSDEDDRAEYYTVDMYSDMWSAGIILAELAKFGGIPISANGSEEEPSMQDSTERLSIDYITHKLKTTLGRGLFCRNTAICKQNLHADPDRCKHGVTGANKGGSNDNLHNVEARGAITDEDLNLILASEIASKCDVDIIQRANKLKREYCWWEYPHFSSGFWALLVNLLSYKPRDRYLAAEALGHPWFDSSASKSGGIFQEIDKLMAEQEKHLPMEHFYYIGSSLSLHSSSKKSHCQADTSPFSIKRQDLMHLENSDIALESIGMFGKVGQTSNAWFAGPLHFRLMALKEPGISLPEFVSQICRRETVVLEAREKEIFGSRGFILRQLLDLKKRYMLKWNEMLSSRTIHLLGKTLIARDYTKR